MLSRRAWLAMLATNPSACFTICELSGQVVQEPAKCAAGPPGSTIKPLIAELLNPGLRFACLRRLEVGVRRLDCVHTPIQGPLDVETALAASCNSWFAQAAQRLDAESLVRAIRASGGEAQSPRTRDELTLAVLGLAGIRFTTSALARAYARLQREAPPAVRRGLAAAVTYGTAATSGNGDLVLAGKTGTVSGGAWFAGWTSRAAIALFVAGGTGGADAAPAAREILRKWHAGLPV